MPVPRHPPADELYRLVHIEYMPYSEVADHYGVDKTTIPFWLDKLGLPRATARQARYRGNPPSLTPEEAVRRYLSGESAQAIAHSSGFKSKTSVLNMLRAMGVQRRPEGWKPNRRLIALDGTLVRSTYEMRVANWLITNRVAYTYEPPVPNGRRCRADFLANGWYIEIWGVHSKPSYAAKKAHKRALYRGQGLPLIELSPQHFARDRHILERRLRQTLQAP